MADRYSEAWQARPACRRTARPWRRPSCSGREGDEFPIEPRDWRAFARRAPWRAARKRDVHRRHPAGSRAGEDSRWLLPGAGRDRTRSPSRSRPPRSPTSCGWRRRPPISTTRGPSPRRSTRLSGQDARLQPVALVQLGHDRHDATTRCAVPRGARQARLRLQLHHLRRPPDRRPRGRGIRPGAERGRDARARPAAAEVPPARVAVPHAADPRRWPALDAALMAASGRTATTKAMGKGSTQHQHLVQTEVPTRSSRWLGAGRATRHPGELRVTLRPHTAGSDLLELRVSSRTASPADVTFATILDRRGRSILSIRDQNTLTSAPAQAPDDARCSCSSSTATGRRRSTTSRRPTTTTARPRR